MDQGPGTGDEKTGPRALGRESHGHDHEQDVDREERQAQDTLGFSVIGEIQGN